jgi:hypothetical protein
LLFNPAMSKPGRTCFVDIHEIEREIDEAERALAVRSGNDERHAFDAFDIERFVDDHDEPTIDELFI